STFFSSWALSREPNVYSWVVSPGPLVIPTGLRGGRGLVDTRLFGSIMTNPPSACGVYLEPPGKVAFYNGVQRQILGKEPLQLINDVQCNHWQKAAALSDDMGQIAHVEIGILLRLARIAKVVEGAHFLVGHCLNLAAQFKREQGHAMSSGAEKGGAIGLAVLFHHSQHHHIDQHSLLRDIIGGEKFHLRLIREARPQRAKSRVQQNGIVDDADRVGNWLLASAEGEIQGGFWIIDLSRAGGDSHKAAKGIIAWFGFDLNLVRPVDLADIIDMRV